MSVARDLKMARLIKRYVKQDFPKADGAYALRTIREARRNKIPLSWYLAVIEQESGFQNIFGCDHGPGNAYCHQKVTNAKVRHLLNAGVANGVGYTQLTSPNYVKDAMKRRGGAASVRNQLIVGAQVLKGKTGGDMKQAWRYNGSPSYQHDIEPRQRKWHRRFAQAGLA